MIFLIYRPSAYMPLILCLYVMNILNLGWELGEGLDEYLLICSVMLLLSVHVGLLFDE